MTDDLWTWPYEQVDIDNARIARVPVPAPSRSFLEKGRRVGLVFPDGTVRPGRVLEFNRIAWIARVLVLE